MGNRIEKKYFPEASNRNHYISDFYVRDAQGNIMATYKYEFDFANSVNRFDLEEFHMYGSSRIGTIQLGFPLYENGSPNPNWTEPITNLRVGHKRYELTNHLGNVMAVVNDRTQGVHADADGIIDYYEATVLKANDYYPFGSLMPGREYSAGDYRYGYNRKEKDDEIKGSGNSYDFGARNYDPRIARFITLDPRMSEFSAMSPYCFAANNPIKFIDVNGEGPGDEKALTIPSSPDKIDTKVWSPVDPKSNIKGMGNGHTQLWFNKENNMYMAFDKAKEGATGWQGKDHFHVYEMKDGTAFRLQKSGEQAGGKTAEGKSYYKKDAYNSHFKPGEATQIKIKMPSAKAVINATAKTVKVVNKVLIPVAVAASVYDVATSDNKPRAAVREASGWAGAWAGGEAGVGAGAAIGAGIGAFFGGVGAAPGAAIGGFIGGLAGGIGGYFAGSAVGEAAYDATTK